VLELPVDNQSVDCCRWERTLYQSIFLAVPELLVWVWYPYMLLGVLHMYVGAFLSTAVLVKHALGLRTRSFYAAAAELGLLVLGFAWWSREAVAEGLSAAAGGLSMRVVATGRFLAVDGSLLLTTVCCTVVGAYVVWGGLRR
jgi:hypothetical protein